MLLQNLRARIGARLNGDSEGGFTLIELLVVMLILGILAAIAIPAFFNQRDKANDASAKSMARTAQTAMETYATDSGGDFEGVDPGALSAIEETIVSTTQTDNPYLSVAAATGTNSEGYELTVVSPRTGNQFSIARAEGSGISSFTCANPSATPTTGNAGCPTGGNWAQ